jgi:putative endonuclease
VNRGERAALRHYRLRGYRLLDANARVGRYELDLVLRRGASLLFVEVKEKSGLSFGHPFEMVDEEKARRVRTAARGWLAAHPELAGLTVSLEVAGVIHGAVERAPLE